MPSSEIVLTLKLKNNRSFNFAEKDLGVINVEDVHQEIHHEHERSRLSAFNVAGHVAVEIFASANTPCRNPCKGLGVMTTRFAEILVAYRDIVAIQIRLPDERASYLIPSNAIPTCTVGDNGNLYLVISKNRTVDDVFPSGMRNSAEASEKANQEYGRYWDNMSFIYDT